MTTIPTRTEAAARVFAWSGGVAFAASMLGGLYLFGVRLGAPPAGSPPNNARSVAVNIVLFTVFAAHHSVFARSRTKAWLARHVPPRIERSVYVWVASLLFLALCAWWQPISGTAWRLDGAWRVLARVLQLGGLACTALGARAIDVLALAGIRQVQDAGRPPRPSATTISTDGLYGWVRHPIYLGWLLIVAPTPDMTWGRFVFAAVSITYLVVAIPWEERSLIRTVGPMYRAYQRQVRWRMLPGVY